MSDIGQLERFPEIQDLLNHKVQLAVTFLAAAAGTVGANIQTSISLMDARIYDNGEVFVTVQMAITIILAFVAVSSLILAWTRFWAIDIRKKREP